MRHTLDSIEMMCIKHNKSLCTECCPDFNINDFRKDVNFTLRDQLAMAALQGLCANVGGQIRNVYVCEIIVKSSYEIADAMLAERER